MREPLLEKVLRRWRLGRVRRFVPEGGALLDLGCGWGASFLRMASPRLRVGYGLDPKAEPGRLPPNVVLLRHRLEDVPWPVPEPAVDLVSLLAVLEHFDGETAGAVLGEARRRLRAGGRLVLTVPTPRGRPVLEFLAYRLGVVNPDEIRDHKVYYDQGLLERTLGDGGFRVESYETFQGGWNSLCVARPR